MNRKLGRAQQRIVGALNEGQALYRFFEDGQRVRFIEGIGEVSPD